MSVSRRGTFSSQRPVDERSKHPGCWWERWRSSRNTSRTRPFRPIRPMYSWYPPDLAPCPCPRAHPSPLPHCPSRSLPPIPDPHWAPLQPPRTAQPSALSVFFGRSRFHVSLKLTQLRERPNLAPCRTRVGLSQARTGQVATGGRGGTRLFLRPKTSGSFQPPVKPVGVHEPFPLLEKKLDNQTVARRTKTKCAFKMERLFKPIIITPSSVWHLPTPTPRPPPECPCPRHRETRAWAVHASRRSRVVGPGPSFSIPPPLSHRREGVC